MHVIELVHLSGEEHKRARRGLMKKVQAVAGVASIPEIMMQAELIEQILHAGYLDCAGVPDMENIRERLHGLMKYIPMAGLKYDVDFDDEILLTEWVDSDLDSDDLRNCKSKTEFHLRQRLDNAIIAKLKNNRDECEETCGAKPLGEFVREVVGLGMATARTAFAGYFDETRNGQPPNLLREPDRGNTSSATG